MGRPSIRRIVERASEIAAETGRRSREDVRRYLAVLDRLLAEARRSPTVRGLIGRLDGWLASSGAGRHLGRFLRRLDAAAYYIEPRLERFARWARSLTRQERAAVAIAAVAIAFLGNRLASLPPLRSIPARSLETAAFFENGWGGAFPSSFPALKRLSAGGAGRGVDVIYPVWHTVMADGSVESVPSREVLAYCRSRSIGVVPAVTNAKVAGGDNAGVLRDRKAMKRAVDALVAEVESNGYDGLNLSFELVPPEDKRRLTEFATSLSTAMKDRGRLFAVSVFPDAEMPLDVSGAYDYARLGSVADVVVLMAYDRHWPGSDQGAVAPLGWVDLAIRRAARRIPVSKITLGVGAYGYDWPAVSKGGKAEYIPASAAMTRAAAAGVQVKWDQSNMEPYYEYASEGVPRVVRFLDRSAVALRVGLARRYGLRGYALWRLGFEEG